VAKLSITVGKKELNGYLATAPQVQRKLWSEAKRVERIAENKLDFARASTEWYKIAAPPHLTYVALQRATTNSQGKPSSTDYLVTMFAPNVWAIEYGHLPSGVFGPGGRYADVKTKPPRGLYLMTMTFVQA
jgi:hypothetical protein